MFYYVFYFLRGDLKMDKTIVKKFKEGDKNAALAVLHKYEPLINKYCLKTNLKGFDKNDLRQEANLSVLKALNAIDLNKDSITYDAYIMNTLFGYKVLKGDVSGFPDTSINKVINT